MGASPQSLFGVSFVQPSRMFLLPPVLGLASLLLWGLEWREEQAPAIVTGVVLDAGTLRPLPGVTVSWKSHSATSDKAGRYQLEVMAGVRELIFSARDRSAVNKMLLIRNAGSRVRLDAMLPKPGGAGGKVLVLDRGSRAGEHGRDLASDVAADSSISLADEFGNNDQILQLKTGSDRVHSPVWITRERIAFAKEGLHEPQSSKRQGVFEFQSNAALIQPLAAETGIRFLSKPAQRESLAIGGDKDLYVLDSLSKPAALRRIFGLGAREGFVLSIFWAMDDRIYFTVDDRVPLDDRHYLTRSRIGSVKPDGADLKTDWASDPGYSFRYPAMGENGAILFGRFDLDGKHQGLWSRGPANEKMTAVAAPALRAIHIESGRLYYIYQQDLHLRILGTGDDWVIVNSVRDGDYLRLARENK